MDKDKRNRIILVIVVSFLLVFVIGMAIYYSLKNKKENENKLQLSVVELYSSDYEIIKKGDYFLGVQDNHIHNVIDLEGKELYLDEDGLSYKNIFETRDNSLLIYNNDNDSLNTYSFDEGSFVNLSSIDSVKYAKAIIYEGKDKNYILGFCSNDNDNLYLYGSNIGIVVLKNTSLVADRYDQINDVYYTNTEYLVVKNSAGLMGLVDMVGNTVIDFQYDNILGLNNGNYIVVNKNGKFNIIDVNNQKLLKKDYQYIDYVDGLYYIIKDNKVSLYDNDLNDLSGFVLDHNMNEYTLRSNNYLNSKKIGSKYYIWNNDGFSNFTNNNLVVVSDKKVEKEYEMKNFGVGDYLYSFDNGELVLYDDNLDQIKTISLSADVGYVVNVTKVENDSLYIQYISNEDKQESYCYIDANNNLYESKYGKLLKKTDNYLIYNKNKELFFVNNKGEVMNNINGDNFSLYGSYLVANNNIYKIIIK